MVFPSCAVTIVVIVLLPSARAIGADAVPLVSVVPFTVTVAVASLVIGVTVNEVIELLTLTA